MVNEEEKQEGFDEYKEPELSEKKEFKCKNCGGSLVFAPGTTSMTCPYCGAENEIEIDESAMAEAKEELDLDTYLAQMENGGETGDGNAMEEISTVSCSSCGATVSFDPNIVSSECPFCGTKLVVSATSSKKLIKPKSLLPFKVKSDEAIVAFRTWIKKLWFVPPKLKELARQCETIAGLYLPYWTYDAQTDTKYRGMRGDNYTETETYYENGESKTRTVTKTRWTHVSGRVSRFFDDVLIPASKSLPRKKLDALAPWDLENIVPYEDRFLSGFRTETYQVDLKEGFDEAKKVMKEEIEDDIRHDIGGDIQKITSMDTSYTDTTFKHTLLPAWLSAYRFNNKVYRFIVNGRTGKVSGERPYCWWKILLFVLGIIAIVVGGIWGYLYISQL